MKLKSRVSRSFIVVLVILAAVIVIRLVLPFFVLKYANRKLAEMKGYYGQAGDIDLALIRGAYKIKNLYINKVDPNAIEWTRLLDAPVIDLSIEWKSLLHGSIVGELDFIEPTVILTRHKVEPAQVVEDSASFQKLLEDFMPLNVNRFEVRNGNVRYTDETSKPKVDIALTHLHAVAKNLRNSYDSASLLPASVEGNAEVYEGTFNFKLKLDPLADVPTFDLNAELNDTNLVKLNEFFQAYAGVDVNKGKFGMYAEVASKEGEFSGYVKPVIKHLDIVGREDRNDNIFRKMWEVVVGAIGEIFQNQPKDQLATKIPFRGSAKDPKADIWSTIGGILKNAFILALQPSIDHEISIATVGKRQKKDSSTRKKRKSGST